MYFSTGYSLTSNAIEFFTILRKSWSTNLKVQTS